MVPSLCCGSLGLWLYLIKRQNKKCLKAKMINYHCVKIKLNHYLSTGPPLSIVPCRTKCWQTAFAFPSSCLTTTFHSLFKGIFLKFTMQQTSLTILVRKIKVLISDFSDLVTKFCKLRIDLVTVFDAILTSRQTREKLLCLCENLMSNSFSWIT